jgi:uncharacterized coiled-coil protein SlyX
MIRQESDGDSRSGARIDELEAQLAEQDQSLLELSNEVYRQQQRIAELEVKLRQLAERIQVLATPEASPDPLAEVPPHY